MNSHHEYSPSKFSAWACCPRYDSAPIDDADEDHPAAVGTRVHGLIASLVSNPDHDIPASVPDEEKYQAVYGANQIRMIIPDGAEIKSEHRLTYLDENFETVYFGTADYFWADADSVYIADIKTGREKVNVSSQLIGYALAAMQATGKKYARCYTVWTRLKLVDNFVAEYETAEKYTNKIITSRKYNADPRPCDYCRWCEHLATCPAAKKGIVAIAENYESKEAAITFDLEQWHSSEITNPEQMAQAMDLARLAEAWAGSVKHHCRKMMMDAGLEEIPGYKLQNRKGAKVITDINKAYALAGLPPEKFLAACKISFNELAEKLKDERGISSAKAKKELEEMLCEVITESDGSISVVKCRKGKDEN
jgi:hypothetical protein